MKYLIILTVLLSTSVHATKKEDKDVQINNENNASAIATTGDVNVVGPDVSVDNSDWLSNQLEQFNKQANQQTIMVAPDCSVSPASVSVDGISVPLKTGSGMVYKNEHSGWGGALCGSMAFGAKKYEDALDARLIREKTDKEVLEKLIRIVSDQSREINRLAKEQNETHKAEK